MNAQGWKVAIGGAMAHAAGDAVVGPMPDDMWWATTIAILTIAAVVCWRGTIDTDDWRAKAAVQSVQLPVMMGAFVLAYAFSHWSFEWFMEWAQSAEPVTPT